VVPGGEAAADGALGLELDAHLRAPLRHRDRARCLQRLRLREAAAEQLLPGQQVHRGHQAGQRGQVDDPAGQGRLRGHQFGGHEVGELVCRRARGDRLVSDEDLDGSHTRQGTAVGAPDVVQEHHRAGGEENDRRDGGEESTLHFFGAPIG